MSHPVLRYGLNRGVVSSLCFGGVALTKPSLPDNDLAYRQHAGVLSPCILATVEAGSVVQSGQRKREQAQRRGDRFGVAEPPLVDQRPGGKAAGHGDCRQAIAGAGRPVRPDRRQARTTADAGDGNLRCERGGYTPWRAQPKTPTLGARNGASPCDERDNRPHTTDAQRGHWPQPNCGTGVPPVIPPALAPVPQFSSRAAKILSLCSTETPENKGWVRRHAAWCEAKRRSRRTDSNR